MWVESARYFYKYINIGNEIKNTKCFKEKSEYYDYYISSISGSSEPKYLFNFPQLKTYTEKIFFFVFIK